MRFHLRVLLYGRYLVEKRFRDEPSKPLTHFRAIGIRIFPLRFAIAGQGGRS